MDDNGFEGTRRSTGVGGLIDFGRCDRRVGGERLEIGAPFARHVHRDDEMDQPERRTVEHGRDAGPDREISPGGLKMDSLYPRKFAHPASG